MTYPLALVVPDVEEQVDVVAAARRVDDHALPAVPRGDEVAHAAAVRHAASETTHPEHGLLKLVECVETRVVAFLRGRELELSNEEDFENPLCF